MSVGNTGYQSGGNQTLAGFDPVLISLIRRSMPNLVAYDLAGVQPMSENNRVNLCNEISLQCSQRK